MKEVLIARKRYSLKIVVHTNLISDYSCQTESWELLSDFNSLIVNYSECWISVITFSYKYLTNNFVLLSFRILQV